MGFLFPPLITWAKASKQTTKQKGSLRGQYKIKMTTRSLWAIRPLNSKHYLCRFPCLNCWHKSCSFIPKAGCSSGLEAMQLAYSLPSLHFFRAFRISEAYYTMIQEGRREVGFLLWHWLLTSFWPKLVYFTKEATEFPSSEFLSKCVVFTMEIHSREKDFPLQGKVSGTGLLERSVGCPALGLVWFLILVLLSCICAGDPANLGDTAKDTHLHMSP